MPGRDKEARVRSLGERLRPPHRAALVLALALIGATAPAWADGPPRFRKELPRFSLEDPRGQPHTQDQLVAHGLVLVVTAPTLKNADAQEGWSRHLRASHPGNGELLVFLEDMSPSWFEGMALERMREAYVPGEPPLLLIDPDGALRAALGVEEDKTVVLVYDRRGGLIHAETAAPSASRARRAWKALRDAEEGERQVRAR